METSEFTEYEDEGSFGARYKRRFPNSNYPPLTTDELKLREREELVVLGYELCGYPRENVLRYIREFGINETFEIFVNGTEVNLAIEQTLIKDYSMSMEQVEAFKERFDNFTTPIIPNLSKNRALVEKQVFWFLHPLESLHKTIFYMLFSTTFFLVFFGLIALSLLAPIKWFSDNTTLILYGLPTVLTLFFVVLVVAEHANYYFQTLLDSDVEKIDMSRPFRLFVWAALGIVLPLLGLIALTGTELGSNFLWGLVLMSTSVFIACLFDYLLTARLQGKRNSGR